MDDIVVKSKKRWNLLHDLRETFDNLRKYKMMLNPKKCVFGVSSGKLLGYMVSSRGDRCKSHQGGSHRKIVATEDVKRNPKDGRYDGCTQSIHIQAG
jgi:hypothetical protein